MPQGELDDSEIAMKTAAEGLDEERNKIRLTTDSGDLDGLIGGIEEGSFYLFYGDQEILDMLVHRFIVNFILPREKGSFEAKCIYFNNTNYYTGRTILNPLKIGGLAKAAGIDPEKVFTNTYVVAAYNERRQLVVAEQVAELMEKDPDIRFLIIHNITQFLHDSKKPLETRQILKQVIYYVWKVASKRGIAIVATANTTLSGKRFKINPRPVGVSFFHHIVNIIVHFKTFEGGFTPSIKATLIKHPYKKTPSSIVLNVSKGGMGLIGRRTSFRQDYQNSLMDFGVEKSI